MPKVSVIIPNYNHAAYLNKRIQSVLNQTYQDFEVLLLDDCSTDNSREIIENYIQKDKRIKKVFNEVNSGSTFKQWNKGISHATGEYIWIAESDDFAEEIFLERLVYQLDNYPTAGLAYCQSWIIDENNAVLHSGLKWISKEFADRWRNSFFNSGPEECRKYLIIHNTIFNASAVLFKKSVYIQAGFVDEQFRYVGDWMQWVKMLLISDVVFVAEHLNYFRKHQHTTRSISYLNFNELNEYYTVLKFIADRIKLDSKVLRNSSLASRWLLASKSPITLTSIINLFKVYQKGKRIDPLIIKRILSYFIVRSKKGLLKK